VSDRFGFTRHPRILRPAGEAPPSSDTAYVSGCCALVRAQAWRDIGPFREDYFAYYEDVEWCMRARQAGWRCRYLGEVLCRHAAGLSSGQRGGNGLTEGTAYYLARNPLRFALETPDPGLRATRVLGILTVWTAYNAWRVARSRDLRVGAAYAAGLGDALRGRMGPRRLTGTRR
jgi:GT2 family glycosyltransferase